MNINMNQTRTRGLRDLTNQEKVANGVKKEPLGGLSSGGLGLGLNSNNTTVAGLNGRSGLGIGAKPKNDVKKPEKKPSFEIYKDPEEETKPKVTQKRLAENLPLKDKDVNILPGVPSIEKSKTLPSSEPIIPLVKKPEVEEDADLYFEVPNLLCTDIKDIHQFRKNDEKNVVVNSLCSGPIQVNGKKIAIVRIHDKIYAFNSSCPHQGADLSIQGDIEDSVEQYLICKNHKAKFDLGTGKCTNFPHWNSLEVYPVKIQNNKVLVKFQKLSETFFNNDNF